MTISLTPSFERDRIERSYKGFKLAFSNGLTISVQFVVGNFCNFPSKNKDSGEITNERAEIAIYRTHTGEWVTKQVLHMLELNDDVVCHVNADDIANYIYMTRMYH